MDTTRKAAGGSSLPKIKVTAEDRERLVGLAAAAMDRMPDLAGYLSDELDRAQVVRAGRSALGFVRMGSEVEFRDDTTGKVQVVSLVYPGEADIGQGRISVLTPVGAALLGLSKGQSIDWATRTGAAKRLTVLGIREPAFA
ncbi:nucleoside diphosphate kinase regulator [Methylorubrum extorquens]|uniref:nucleoside diphosphate kinase regulator n=1 Tax=Methylorubrum extorquens TaxID=408 RepID=UPI002937EC06|nr:nucleoside diphosphate kinase regulator [Methylobacteriaceae bacterium AG10]